MSCSQAKENNSFQSSFFFQYLPTQSRTVHLCGFTNVALSELCMRSSVEITGWPDTFLASAMLRYALASVVPLLAA